ncbi:hypothetical protein B0A52_01598 [Exophiala mesophila]|uniref:N-acetyltransferase domain-containing protein n=1 Tax=Exophiala mesophila TaxID=212818 RepID=A0A438NFG0_EXOME|nr:hypothetical protein B0A52_01598 [Exophiala mesophila]
MHRPEVSFRSLTILVLMLMNWPSTSICSVQTPLITAVQIRNATMADATRITTIVQEAFHDSPETQYVYQFMDQHPHDYFNCVFGHVKSVLHDPTMMVQIALLPDNNAPHRLVPAAVAFWEFPTAWSHASSSSSLKMLNGLFLPSLTDVDTLEVPEACLAILNFTRLIDFDHQLTTAKRQYLDQPYPPSHQFYLDTLGTLPDYQRRGAGGALVRSGLDFAKETMGQDDNVTATLIATPAGEPLYLHLGWDSLKNFTVTSLDRLDGGGKEEWVFDVMKYDLE